VAAVHRYSQGIPRLINTICENALIAAYARQAVSIAPEIIEGIAKDFRLGVHSPTAQKKKAPDDLDFRKAAKTLLELYAHLQSEQARERDEELATARLPTVIKQ
jgi:general secretion pathway protein A